MTVIIINKVQINLKIRGHDYGKSKRTTHIG